MVQSRNVLAQTLGALAVASAGCVTPATEIVLRVDSDFGDELVRVEVELARLGDARREVTLRREFPVRGTDHPVGTLGITPRSGDDARPLDVRVTGVLADGRALERQFIVRFEPRKTLVLDVFFTTRCTGPNAPVCPSGTTCGLRGCEPVEREMLPELGADAPSHTGPDGTLDAPPAHDAVDVGPGDAPSDGPGGEIAPPRPVAPLSAAWVTSRRPTLRWALPATADGARVELCRRRSCDRVEATLDAAGTSVTVPSDLAPGAWFWRLRGRAGEQLGASTGPVWEFFVGARSAPVNSGHGVVVDLNGDGFADMAVGAPGALGRQGRVYIRLGSAAGPSPTATAIDGPIAGTVEFGTAVAAAGDVNGDGYVDLLVGGPRAYSKIGSAFLYFGSPSGPVARPATSLQGPAAEASEFGAAVTSLGDFNGDGYADVAIGLPESASGTGAVAIYLGGPTGLATMPYATLTGVDSGDGEFGIALSGGGDLNGDGLGDLAVGAHKGNGGLGRVLVYLGSPTRVPSTPDANIPGPTGSSRLGGAVSAVGDLNGDGFADVVAGAPASNSATGQIYVYAGGHGGVATMPTDSRAGPDGANGQFGAAVSSAGDINGDGYADLVVGAPGVAGVTMGRAYVFLGSGSTLATADPVRLTAPDGALGNLFGRSVALGGSINGDGLSDVVIGAVGAMSATGKAYIHFGNASGLSTTPAMMLDGPDGAGGQFGAWVAHLLGTGRGSSLRWL